MDGFLIRKDVSFDHSLNFKSDDSTGEIEVMFGHHNSIDSDNDIIRKGAYDKTIVENLHRIKHIKNHDITKQLGKVLEIKNTDEGIIMISKMMLNHSEGRDAYEEYKAGIITEHSQGFYTKKSNKLDSGVREITELKLMEISSVVWGANEHTPTLHVKSLQTLGEAESFLMSLSGLLSKSNISDLKGREYEKVYKAVKTVLAQMPEPGSTHSNNAKDPFDTVKFLETFNNL